MLTEISKTLLGWYERHARQLPWRNHPDAYAVWVSEIMLQQTRVDTVLDYFQRWMEAFPTIHDLANASEQKVLKLWEGLGYYSRARNLHKAAKMVQEKWQGTLPKNRKDLESLPGIGRYTAAAIASMAFGQDEATLDGNIRRILARLFNVQIPARSPEGEKLLWQLAEDHLPAGRAGDYNQAWMDLGASICLPRNPRCLICPLQSYCQAFEQGTQEDLPVLPARKTTPHHTVTAAIIQQNNKVLIARRPSHKLLGGLWEFPGGKVEPREDLKQGLIREIQEELGCQIQVEDEFGVYQHAFTHFRITLHAFFCKLTEGEPTALEASEIAWVTPEMLTDYPMGKVDRQIATKLASD